MIATSRRCSDRNFLNNLITAVVLPADIGAFSAASKTTRSRRTASSFALSAAAVFSFTFRSTNFLSIRILDEEPWRSAFVRERALPSDVRGPVLLAALRLLAVICFSDAISATPASQREQRR
jgi:CO/xanthine dehydrogenase FAD-binding subunit